MTIILYLIISFIAGAAFVYFFTRARLSDKDKFIEEQRLNHENAFSNLETMFKGVSLDVLKESREEFLKQAEPKIAEQVRPLADALKRYDDAVRVIELKREEAYGGISKHIGMLGDYTRELKNETMGLKTALKSPVTRGRWGEVTLKRVVELAGMSEHCDFEEQANSPLSDDTRQRPDMIVKLPGGRVVVVDAKAPLDSYMKAVEASDEKERKEYLMRHALAVREHLRRLGQKAYWEQFERSPDFVVLFLPGESFFSAALEVEKGLIEEGMASRVIMATPTTLIALLRAVGMGWQQEKLAENAEKISKEGKELFDRFVIFSDHFGKIGGNLDKTIKAFNSAVRSFDSRIMPSAKRLVELGVAKAPDTEIPQIEQIETMPHQVITETTVIPSPLEGEG